MNKANKADKRTLEYLLQLMRTIPDELMVEAREIRCITEQLRTDIQRMANRVTMLERRVGNLCDTAQKAMGIGPLMDTLREEGTDAEQGRVE